MAKAQVGDLVRITGDFFDDESHIGEVREVVEIEGDFVIVDAKWSDGSDMNLLDDEYEIYRKAGEESGEKAARLLRKIDEHFVVESKKDAVNHPNHYTQGRFETIEVIEEITKGYDDGFIAYCIGNTLKYIARAPFKHGSPAEDLAKAKRYIEFAIEHLDAKSTQD